MDELLCASLFPIIGFSTERYLCFCVCVCVCMMASLLIIVLVKWWFNSEVFQRAVSWKSFIDSLFLYKTLIGRWIEESVSCLFRRVDRMRWGLCGLGSSVSELEDVLINEEMRPPPLTLWEHVHSKTPRHSSRCFNSDLLVPVVCLCFRCKGVIDSRGQRINCSHFVVEEGFVGVDRKRMATPARSEPTSPLS